MDHQRDYPRFKNLVRRICTTLDKYTGPEDFDPLMESWWKALRHVDYTVIERAVERFLGHATEKTPFPRPSQMRPKEIEPPVHGGAVRNHVRDYWRSCVINCATEAFGFRFAGQYPAFMRVLADHPELAPPLQLLLNELEEQEVRNGRSHGMHIGCNRRCEELARAYPHLRHPNALPLPAPERDEQLEELF